MTSWFCKKHAVTIYDDGVCEQCADEVAEEHPEFAPVVKRARRWRAIYAAYTVIVALVVTAGYWAFVAYREWVIWTR